MGLNITKNDKGEYQLISTISNESYHPDKEWVSEAEAKKILIEDAFINFVNKAIEIDMTFPQNYRVNDINPKRSSVFNQWVLDAYESENVDKIFADKFEEIHSRLKLDIKI